MRAVKVYPEAWPLHTPFVIARGTRSEAGVVVVELEEEGFRGGGGMYALSAVWRNGSLGAGADCRYI